MPNVDLETIRKDLATLSKEEFEKKYAGIKEEGMSDAELEKVAGGWILDDGTGKIIKGSGR